METKRIWLSVDVSHGCHRHFAVGVAAFGAARSDWDLAVQHYHGDDPASGPLAMAGAVGLIAPHNIPADMLALAKSRGVPVVLYGDATSREDALFIPQCYPDEVAIGAAAAEHLLERGFRSFAYIGSSRWPCSKARGAAFEASLGAAGYPCTQLAGSRRTPSAEVLDDWLAGLQTPCGILALNDLTAHHVLHALRQTSLRCPGDVALLGVDNDELLCSLSRPTLSSIDTDWEAMGQQAAQVLSQLIEGNPTEQKVFKTTPRRVVLRQSSDFLAIRDERVLRALCFIRGYATEGVSVDQVLEEVGCSRPTLDGHFKMHLGHTVSEEISRTKMRKVMRLLEETDASIQSIAYQCGFNYLDRMFRLFKKTTGMTPGQYRRQERARPCCG